MVYIGKVAYRYKGEMPCGTSVVIKEGSVSISPGAFYDCSGLTSVAIPDSVTSIDDGAFEGCSGLTSVTIPDSVTSIGEDAFKGCFGLISVTIGDRTFLGCYNLTSVAIGTSVTSIGNRAFEDCTRLTSVTIPCSVTKIGHRALYSEYLCEIYSLNPIPPVIGMETFRPSFVPGCNLRIYVPEGCISEYKTARYWKMFESCHAIVVPHDGVTDGDDDLK